MNTWWRRLLRKFAGPESDEMSVQSLATPTESMRLVIGENITRPALVIQEATSESYLRTSKAVEFDEKLFGRLNALMQAAPSLTIVGKTAGKRIMEVVVHGDLTRAADGNGFRAMVHGANGISNNARLFDLGNLQQLINVAAIWQVASVIVAQKHLADISAKLDAIKDGINQVSQFLTQQRSARITAMHSYIDQARRAIQAGELPASIRFQLERCEIDLLEIQYHLDAECLAIVDDLVVDKAMFGATERKNKLSAKIAKLDTASKEYSACIQTRVAVWNVLNLYPGEPALKEVRREAIQASIDRYYSLAEQIRASIQEEITKVDAVFARQSTLKTYWRDLTEENSNLKSTIESSAMRIDAAVKGSQSVLLENNIPVTYLMEYDGAELVTVRLSG